MSDDQGQDTTAELPQLHPILAIQDTDNSQDKQPEDSVAQLGRLALNLASALSDILPTYWDKAHPSANLFQAAKDALDAYQDSVK